MYGFLSGLLYTVHIISCIILIVVVLLHESKGDSLASVFGGGGADSAFGVQFGKKISRFTIGAAALFLLMAIILGIWSNAPIQEGRIKADKAGPGSQMEIQTEETGQESGQTELPAGE